MIDIYLKGGSLLKVLLKILKHDEPSNLYLYWRCLAMAVNRGFLRKQKHIAVIIIIKKQVQRTLSKQQQK